MNTIIIKKDSNNEYRVPGPKETEAQAYYTEDKEDAINTAKFVFGNDVKLKIKNVEEF